MCGISLIAQKRRPGSAPNPSAEKIQTAWTQSALSLQAHRGPDHSSTEALSSGLFDLSIGHCRLAIIDLDTRSQQPMWSQDRNLCLSYNGELFNYRDLREELTEAGHVFSTESDTEVLLKAWEQWGVESLNRCDGMFAFVVVDFSKQKIFAARDALGVKPLYWKYSDEGLAVSSEIWPLVEADSTPNLQTVVDYVALGYYDVADTTFVEGIHRLEGGHAFEFDLSDDAPPRIWDWWAPDFSTPRSVSYENALEEVKSAVLLSIERQLMSDVPLGFALSGGLDSSVLVCGARAVAPHAKIETITYSPGELSGLDESPWAKIVSDFVGAEPTTVTFEAQTLSEELQEMVRCQGEPFSTTRIFAQFKVFENFRRRGITVAIEGQGGDELFAGYDGFPHFRILSLVEGNRFGEAIAHSRRWLTLPNHRLGRLFLQFLSILVPPRFAPQRVIYAVKAKVLGEDIGRVIDWRGARKKGVVLRSSWRNPRKKAYASRRLVEALLMALRKTYIPQLVRQGDRNAMVWSVENRVPFLSKDLVEVVLSLPEDYLAGNDGFPKSLLRASMRGVVPDAILDRKDKVGFATSQSNLVYLAGFDTVHLATKLRELGIFEPSFLEKFANRELIVTESNYMLWRVLNLAIWIDVFESFKARVPAPLGPGQEEL